MWIFLKKGTFFASTFLAIITLSHAFVFWIPVWKRESVVRFQPRRGWLPIKTRGSGLGIFPQKHFGGRGVRDAAGGTSLHHIYSKLFPKIHHSPHPHHSPKPRLPPLFNLNHHHPLCPLCHLHSHHRRPHHHPNPLHKFRRPFHSGSSNRPFFRNHHPHPSHHHPFSFSPSSPKHTPYFPHLFKTFSHSPPKYSSQFNSFPSKSFFDFPPHFQDFPKFSSSPLPPKTSYDFPKTFTSFNPNQSDKPPHHQTYSTNYNQNKYPKKSLTRPGNYYESYPNSYPNYSSSKGQRSPQTSYSDSSSKLRNSPQINYSDVSSKLRNSPQSSYSYSPGAGYSYNDNYSFNTNNYKKSTKSNYYNFYNNEPELNSNPSIGDGEDESRENINPFVSLSNPTRVSAQTAHNNMQEQTQPSIGDLPSAKEFGFSSGFGNGEKGHGWAGWDW